MVLALVFGALINSCGDSTGPTPVQVPASVQIVAGDEQSGTVGKELPNPLTARVLDEEGRPIAGQLVNFRVVEGNGSVFAGAATTNREGIARDRWTVGTSVTDGQKVEARAVDPSSGAAIVFAVFRATALPDVPASVSPVAGSGQVVPAGSALPDSLLVQVRDKYDNPVPDVRVAWTVPQGGGTITPTADITSATGHASAKWMLGTTAGTYTASAAVEGLAPATFAAAVTATAPAQLLIHDGNGQTVEVLTAIDVRVRLVDAHGNGVGGVPVFFFVR